MSENISEIVLFYSNFSVKCKSLLNFISHHNLPIQKLCVDSKKIRELVSKKIKGVPTLFVTHTGGNIDVFENEDSIAAWLKNLLSAQNAPITEEQEGNEEENDGDYEILEQDEPLMADSYKPKKNVKEQKMAEIKDLAKQMEQERKNSLGYDESSLPY